MGGREAPGRDIRLVFSNLALSRFEESVGNTTRAQDLAVRCAQLRKDDPDPWWDYAASFDHEAFIDLRAEARRR